MKLHFEPEKGASYEAPPHDPAVVTTRPRDLGSSGFSRTTAALDLVPLAGGHVRVWVRGESHSALGARTKVFTLSPGRPHRVQIEHACCEPFVRDFPATAALPAASELRVPLTPRPARLRRDGRRKEDRWRR